MVIIGAKGFAKELLEICIQNKIHEIVFYDDINTDAHFLYEKFPILNNFEQICDYFKSNNNYQFTLGLGNPLLRYKMHLKIKNIGGVFTSIISPNINMGTFDIHIGDGCNILAGVAISNSANIGKGTIIYYNSIITHDCQIGDFVQISPNVITLGRCKIGDFSYIGAGSIILPDVIIGSNVIVGAGSLITKDVPDNCTVVGTPAKITKTSDPLNL